MEFACLEHCFLFPFTLEVNFLWVSILHKKRNSTNLKLQGLHSYRINLPKIWGKSAIYPLDVNGELVLPQKKLRRFSGWKKFERPSTVPTKHILFRNSFDVGVKGDFWRKYSSVWWWFHFFWWNHLESLGKGNNFHLTKIFFSNGLVQPPASARGIFWGSLGVILFEVSTSGDYLLPFVCLGCWFFWGEVKCWMRIQRSNGGFSHHEKNEEMLEDDDGDEDDDDDDDDDVVSFMLRWPSGFIWVFFFREVTFSQTWIGNSRNGIKTSVECQPSF